MKRSTRQGNFLSLVTSPSGSVETHEQEKAAALRESFDGWLSSVAPTLLQSTWKHKPEPIYQARRSLTSTDIIRVNRATVRESTVHRHWPPEVVINFLAADVIKPNKR